MSKTPKEMAIDYCEPILSDDYARAIGREDWIGTRCVKVGEGHEMYKAFLAGYKAAKAIVEEELQAVQAQRAEYPGLGAAQYALKNVLAKMGSK